MKTWTRSVGYGGLNDVYDQGDDTIHVQPFRDFTDESWELVRAEFFQGSDPLYVASCLWIFATMLEGPEGDIDFCDLYKLLGLNRHEQAEDDAES